MTDANLLLGYLDPAGAAGGRRGSSTADAAERAVGALAARARPGGGGDRRGDRARGQRRDGPGGAGGHRGARASTRASWRWWPSAARGRCTPRRSRRSWGWTRVVAPVASGVLSALGLAVSERRRDLVESVLLAGRGRSRARPWPRWSSGWATRGREELAPARELRATYDLRYAGQAFELPVEGALAPDPADLRAAFDRAHAERYGYSDAGRGAGAGDRARGGGAARRRGRAGRGGRRRAPRERAARGSAASGTTPRCWARARRRWRARPSFELPGSTLVVPPGWSASADGEAVVMERATRPDRAAGDARRAARRLRRDGRRAGALGPLGEHEGAPRRLHRPVRRRAAGW